MDRLRGIRQRLTTTRTVHEVEPESNLDTLIRESLDRLDARIAGTTQVLTEVINLSRKVDQFMATQEERLQAILTAVKNVKQMLTELKANNPAIEDEITAIEAELAPAEPQPGEGGGGGETPA